MMQALIQKKHEHGEQEDVQTTPTVLTEQSNCIQIRKELDALFDGREQLENTSELIRYRLLKHLMVCNNCCRSFDVRASWSSRRRSRLL